jgi:hypothetical protein
MSSEPDSTARRPPTIDLTATEVAAEKAAAAEGPAATKQPGERSSGHLKHQAVGAVVGAVIVAGIIAGLWFVGYVPPHEPASPSSAPANPSLADDLAARIDKIEGVVQTQQPDAALAARVTAAETAEKSQSDALAALTSRVNDAATAAQDAQAQAKTAVDTADAASSAAQAGVSRGDVDALASRVAAVESAVKALSDATHQTPSADDRVARLMVAAGALRVAVERGAPYQAELAAVKTLGADQSATAPLEPFAATGAPSAAALARELTSLLPALLQAAVPAASNASFLERLEANAQQLVRFTPINVPLGDDPATVVERIGIEAAHADIAAALADISKLPTAAQSAAAAWVQKAKARDATIAAAGQIAATALAALGTPTPQ